MRPVRIITEKELQERANELRFHLKDTVIFTVPRGGTLAFSHVANLLYSYTITTDPKKATVIFDDIIDSGATRDKYKLINPNATFIAMFNKSSEWLVFPWETSQEDDAKNVIIRQLQLIGEDPTREGLLDTPKRVVKSWNELYSGYNKKPEDVLGTVFSSDSDQIIICKDIEYYSQCEHHMIPFFGRVHIGYLPNGKVIGLSKLARLVEVYARRLQIQEQLTTQIATALMTYIPKIRGCAVIVEGKHLCMCGRGVGKQNSSMLTSAMLGEFRTSESLRNEFLSLINK